jgi:hypothetical protein
MEIHLTTAIIAAGAALLGSALGQLGPLFQHWLSRRHERRVLLRQKYEQMATSMTNLAIHLDRRVCSLRLSKALQSNPELLQESVLVHTLALLYFPELVPAMQTLRTESMRLDLALAQGKGDEATVASTAFAKARTAATELIQKYAQRYT